MKMIFFILLFITISFSAQIDTKLFDNNDKNAYYIEIEKLINTSKIKKSKPLEIIKEEQKYLKSLKELSDKNIVIDESIDNFSLKEEISLENLLKIINLLSLNKQKLLTQNILQNSVQEKLSYLKKKIENITEVDKQRVLSYQLQFAYYKIQKSNIDTRSTLLLNFEKKLLDVFEVSINKIKPYDDTFLENDLLNNEKNIKTLTEQKIYYQIELEKERIDENKTNIEKISNKIFQIDSAYEKELKEKTALLLKKLINSLSKKNEVLYFDTYKQFDNQIFKLKDKEKHIYISEILQTIAKKRLGNTKLILATSSSQIKDFYTKLKNQLTTTLFVFNEQAISFLSMLKSIFIIVIGIFLGILYKKWLFKLSLKWQNMTQMSLKISSNVGFYLIIFITLMIAMSSLGIDLSSISLIAGALSIGIGFGLQTVVSNFIAGIILMFERTIRIGDIIELNDLLKGIVTDIRIRSTTIKTFDNIDIIVPNSSFIQSNVINWTLEDASRRLHVPFGVAYGTKIELVKEVIFEELMKSSLLFLKDEDKLPQVRMESMNSSSVDLELLVWVKANDKLQANSLKSDFLILIYNTLYKYNIEIPFPQLDLHLKKSNVKIQN